MHLVRGDLTRYCSVTTSARRPCGLPCPGRVAFAGEPPAGVVGTNRRHGGVVESGRSRTTVSSPTSRRDLHSPGRERRRRPPGPIWAPRAAVLVALGVATIAVPLVDAASPSVAAADVAASLTAGYPTAYDILSGPIDQQGTPTSLLVDRAGQDV